MKQSCNTPILFLVFNRVENTKKVFEEIKKAKPKKLYIAADGPRNAQEKRKTEAVRNYIQKNITWKCAVKKLFRDKNLGCKIAVSSAIDWFFENEKQGIILEDDCLPNKSFFLFCEAMLHKYKTNEKISHISGTNVQGKSHVSESYFFSKTFNVWGWATWRRAWKHYDVSMNYWKKSRFKLFKIEKQLSLIDKLRAFRIYEATYRGKIDTWDYQWGLLCLLQNKLSIIPKNNLITNLGFTEGTHTTNYNLREKTLQTLELEFPLKENNSLTENIVYKKKYINFFKS